MTEDRPPADRFRIASRLKSFQFAGAGIVEMLRTQHNAWLHLAATFIVVIAGTMIGVTTTEWCFLIVACTSVWVAEALNTAFEYLCDVASPEFHPLVKKSKDVAAGAVLLAAIGSLAIALVIFVPYLRRLAE